MTLRDLPVPDHYRPETVGQVWRVPYQELATAARQWAQRHGLAPAAADGRRLGLLLVDVQNTFCIPGFELFVGGRSGQGAVQDNRRLCEFLYRNLGSITHICATLDTHRAAQIFHSQFLVDGTGEPPPPYSQVSVEAVEEGRWRFNPALAPALGLDPEAGQRHLLHYVRRLRAGGQYELTVWPYHAMLGGVGHALVAAVEEAVFFHGLARHTQPRLELKGSHPLTESYSGLRPEVSEGADGQPVGQANAAFLDHLLSFDALVVAGQAKSHCVAWTVQDLLDAIQARQPSLARRVYLLEDCVSPVVVPGVIDYTDAAAAAYERFAAAGMHLVSSTEPLSAWPVP
ncbi:MAG: isochorismatase [Gemmatimonadota bacterium]